MAVVMRAEVALSAQNRLKPGLAAAARELERFRQLQARAAPLLRAQETMDRVGGTLRTGIGLLGGAGLVAGIGRSVTQFANVERSMTRIGITGDATRERVVAATAELQNMAYQTAMPFEQLQKGLESLTASGMQFDEAMKMLPSVVRTAQAAGADVGEVATSSQAMMEHFKISVEQLSEAQDILAKGGKLGKFELKDMARYLPSILPAAKAVGLSGTEGLGNLVSMLQVIRSGTGSAEEAAASMQNIFAKMESEATVKNFKDMGVDLPKALAKARKEGKDLLTVLLELVRVATKNDSSKVPQLFPDMEVARGIRPLMSAPEKIREFNAELKKSVGTIDSDFNRVMGDTKTRIDQTAASFSRLTAAVGSFAGVASSTTGITDGMQSAAERLEAAAREMGERGLLRTIVNTPKTSGSIAQDIATEIGKNLKEIGPRQIETGFGPAADPRELEAIQADMRSLDSAPRPDPNSRRGRYLQTEEKAKQNLRKWFLPPGLPVESDARARAALANRVTGPVIATMTGMPEQFTLSASDPLGLGASVPQAAAIVSEVNKIGPAGQQAGAQVAAGMRMAFAEASAEVDRLQQKMNSLRFPGIPRVFGAGGGFNTGKSMREIE
jgi:TP901 family phage tail tape measure protein